MNNPRFYADGLLAALCLISAEVRAAEVPSGAAQMLESRVVHLGIPGQAEWVQSPPRVVDAERLELKFSGQVNAGEATLRIRQAGVKLAWPVVLNGRKIGLLNRDEASQETLFPVPPGLLREGENILSINAPAPPAALDDIDVGPVTLLREGVSESLSACSIEVDVRDVETRRGIPCRLTLTNKEGVLVPLQASPAGDVAVRTGVVYTRGGKVALSVPPGEYVLYAGRGFEWSVAKKEISVSRGGSEKSLLELRREVSTEGWIAADSHIHTLTHSRHGDASVQERALTIAGEGIELAIATEHNHHTDYVPVLVQMGFSNWFTSVMGNEITTKRGHFNAFPLFPDSPVVDAKEEDWARLIPAIRATRGVEVITLNHPRDLHSGFVPFGQPHFNPSTGAHDSGESFKVDAIEVVTSGALQSDVTLLYRDWFALLNHGHRIAAIASSDTHDVSRFILGQGRTYVAANDADPSKVPLQEVWRSYKEGRLLVSMGLLANISVNGRYGVGDLVPATGPMLSVKATVSGPAWVSADHVALYANGILVREQGLEDKHRAGEKAVVTWEIPRPSHDVFLVVIATGPGVREPYWEIPHPYQPSSPVFTPKVIGSTNPVWVDCDGDGRFQSALDYAKAILRRSGGRPAEVQAELKTHDASVALQLEGLGAAAAK